MIKSLIMAKTIRTYSQWRQEKLTDPERAARYLNAAKRESREAFLHAVKNVIQANQVTKIAKEVGVTRESVYRSFSAEGNPAFYTIDAVMKKLDIEIGFRSALKTAATQVSTPARARKRAVGRAASAKRTRTPGLSASMCAAGQMSFDFTSSASAPRPVPAVQQSMQPNVLEIAGNSASSETFLTPYLSRLLLERNHGYPRAFNASDDIA
jgi:probable addiction module antidote protein